MNKLLLLLAGLLVAQAQAGTPAGRFWHAMTSNTAASASASRLYVFGGNGGWQAGYVNFNDVWYYRVDTGSWTQVVPLGTDQPSARSNIAWSCGGGRCVTAGGVAGHGQTNETWYYTESANGWTQVSCEQDAVCPSARAMATMAYDPTRGYHVHFGGMARSASLSDTYTFDGSSWTQRAPSTVPPSRRSAHMVFVPSHTSRGVAISMDRVVLFGGQVQSVRTLCDMYSWNGSDWERITASARGPCVHSATMVWDTSVAANPRLLVANGYVDTSDTQNTDFWYFTFDSTTSGTWTKAATPPCSPRQGALGAYDRPSQTLVFFGGGARDSSAFDDTLVCRVKEGK